MVEVQGSQVTGHSYLKTLNDVHLSEYLPLPEPPAMANNSNNPQNLPHWTQRWRIPAVVATLVLVCLFAVSPNYRWETDRQQGPFAGDFLQEWLGGYMITSGDPTRLYDAEYAEQLQHDAGVVGFTWDDRQYLPIVYPPFYYVTLSFLAYLPVRWATWLWVVAMIGCLVATVALLDRYANRKSCVPGATVCTRVITCWPWALPLALLFMPVLQSLGSCQKGTLCLLILTATFLLLHRQRTFVAGMVFGLLLFKPQMTLVIGLAMLFKRQWWFAAGSVATGIVCCAMSLVVGTDACADFIRFTTGAAEYHHTAGYDLFKSHCVYGFFTLLSGQSDAGWIQSATVLTIGAIATMLGVILRGRIETRNDRFAWQFSALVVATVLCSPHLFTYDLTILLLPIALVTLQLQQADHHAGQLRHALGWHLVLIFCLPGISVSVAAASGLQMTVPLILSLLTVLTAKLAPQARGSADSIALQANGGRQV